MDRQILLEKPKFDEVLVKSVDGEIFTLKPIDILEERNPIVLEELGIEKGTFQTTDGETYWLELDRIHNAILKQVNVEDLEYEDEEAYDELQYFDDRADVDVIGIDEETSQF